jgi:hypothetical protein
VKFDFLRIVAMLALGTLCPASLCSAQDRPLGDVARETRAQVAQSPKPSKTLTIDESGAAISATDDPLDVVTKAAAAMLRDTSPLRCHQLGSGSSHPGLIQEMTTEFVGNDRIHLIGVQGNQSIETILIGKDAYRKIGNAAWAKIDRMEFSMFGLSAFKLPDQLKFGYKPGDLRLIGPEMIGGVPTLHYQSKVHDITLDRTIDIWVGVNDGLPRKTEMSDEMTPNGRPQPKTSWDETTDCTYGIDIKIEAPM